MRADLQLFCDAGHREVARNMFMFERLVATIDEAKLNGTLNPADWDLNPHLQASTIIKRFNEATRS